MSKRIAVAVISDLVTDQRVHKVCRTLQEDGHAVTLIGSKKRTSLPLTARTYTARRIGLLFQKKVFFYAEFNLRLFFRLLFLKTDIILSNDLDTLPACFLAARIRRKPIVYDTHEYFLGMPELKGRPGVKRIWQRIESFIFPKLDHVYTICESFCALYKTDYQKELKAVRNVPYLQEEKKEALLPDSIRSRIPENKKVLLFQGAGINPERGVEELVMAMQYLDPQQFHLLIVGGGDIFNQIIELVERMGLTDRITILPKQPFEILRAITRKAQLGLSLDKPTNINHLLGLPNKIFDYLHCGVPVLVSRLVELEKIVLEYRVGTFIENHDPPHIADRIREALADPRQLEIWKENTAKLRQELNWEKEGKIVAGIFKQVEAEMS
jgi:glycosyltransferase involved in cell wall biosynthesis